MIFSRIVSLLFLFNVIFSWNGRSEEIIPLDKGWTFKNLKKTDWKPATVPGVIHLDLLKNGEIDDPYKGNNEITQRWIEFEDWEYKTNFTADSALLRKKHIELVFEGLDTYSTIFINGKEVLATDNMFREWVVDAKPHLKPGTNEIRIIFHSPLNLNKKNVENARYELPAANETVDLKVSPYTRKAAYHFGWDWGPRFVTCGIWRPVFMRTWNDLRLENLNYKFRRAFDRTNSTDGYLQLEFEMQSDKDQICTLYINGNPYEKEVKSGLNIIKQSIYVNNVKNWNPKEYGEQNFQKSCYSVRLNNRTEIEDTLIWAARKIELIREKDAIGTSFYFKVNDQPFYAKGANYIPQDLFLPRVDSARYEKLIRQAVDAHINMIRVWGGGIYENDYFYDLCDQNGILVWQDFMFANSMYPNDPSFIDNIRAEIEYNVKRLRHHPCLALWCGNNEIEVAWNNWGWQKQYGYSKKDEAEIWNNYRSIFHELIPQLLEKLDPDRPYVPTTPLSNWGKEENFNHSSMHYWGVWHGREAIENFATNVGRFMAEYGYQSFPSYQTLLQVIDSADLNLESETMKNRQKSYIGNGIIDDNVKKYAYAEPNFEKWVELTQLVQAHAYGFAIRQHRLQSPHCMGTLFWQLNDCWPGPSWSVLDYYGNEKAAYTEVQNYYQPIAATFESTEEGLACFLLSDKPATTTVSYTITAQSKNNLTATIYEGKAHLSFLKPEQVFLTIPPHPFGKKNKKETISHFNITIIEAQDTVFQSNYYPEKNTTVQFPILN